MYDESAFLYVSRVLVNLMIHPWRYGWFSFLGVLLLALIGFLTQRALLHRTGKRWLLCLPAGVCLLSLLYGELRWNGWISVPGDGAGFLPNNRFSAFLLLFLAIPALTGILVQLAVRCFSRLRPHL